DGNRQKGISLLQEQVNPDIILLDDAFQHRKVRAGFNILLSTYNDLYVNDFVLPTGNLREPRHGAKRADVIVVTKCPDNLSQQKKKEIITKIKPKANQIVLFSSIAYSNEFISDLGRMTIEDIKSKPFTLVTGIANAKLLVDYLDSKNLTFSHSEFKDHHDFTNDDIDKLKTKTLVVTTEKDYMRLKNKVNVNLFYLPIEVKLHEQNVFNELLNAFVNDFKHL
ncbi:MAG: tetraacyldisaccharide 4'-kinase, partial [Flavobacteriaceae bacterium]|nr:tetraacyldisaccharide 4'-kinase [Flavobacteriaceae bacterium]